MREPILKAVAMPPRIFWAPLLPAALNFAMQTPFMLLWVATGRNPLVFAGTVAFVHAIIVIYSVPEPHLSKMTESKGRNGPITTRNVYPERGRKLAP